MQRKPNNMRGIHPGRSHTKSHNLQIPLVRVGQHVNPDAIFPKGSREWHFKQIIRWEIRDTMKIISKLRKNGFAVRQPGTPMLDDHNKKNIRRKLDIMLNAYEVEIAGIFSYSGQNGYNQCYVGGSHAWSGVYFCCQLLFRAVNEDGQHLHYVSPPRPFLFMDRSMSEIVIPD